MLVKGFNCPIVLLLESDLTDISDFHAQLTDTAGQTLQEWDMDSAVIEQNTVILPVKQAESLAYPAGRALVTAEWSVSGKPKGGTQPAPVLIADYPDKSILGSDETVTEYTTTISAAELPEPWEFSTNQLRTAVVVKVAGGGSSYDDTELRQLIANECTARSSADSTEAAARAEADSDEAAARATADNNEAKTRAAADSSLQAYLEAETVARAEAVSTEAEAREAADAEKANAADVYTKTEADALLAKKSNAANVYSKAAADALLAGKADTDHTHTVSQITDFPDIPEDWTGLVYGVSTLEEVAAAWPKCLVLFQWTDTFYQIAWPVSNVNGTSYLFSLLATSGMFSYQISDEGWKSFPRNFVQVESLQQVAYTGKYTDLTDLPTIPTVSNDFTDTYKGEVDTLWADYRTALTLIGGES